MKHGVLHPLDSFGHYALIPHVEYMYICTTFSHASEMQKAKINNSKEVNCWLYS